MVTKSLEAEYRRLRGEPEKGIFYLRDSEGSVRCFYPHSEKGKALRDLELLLNSGSSDYYLEYKPTKENTLLESRDYKWVCSFTYSLDKGLIDSGSICYQNLQDMFSFVGKPENVKELSFYLSPLYDFKADVFRLRHHGQFYRYVLYSTNLDSVRHFTCTKRILDIPKLFND